MAILDKQGLQHYANKMCNADNRKVGSKSLPTALNDIDIAIDGFKTLFETEYGTPVNMELENNENIFSIGTGTNIDKKDDVENSFTDLKIGGNTLVNLYPKPIRTNYASVGNAVSFNEEKINIIANGNYQNFFLKKGTLPVKPSTSYTLIVNVLKNSLQSTGNASLYIANSLASEPSIFSEGFTLPLNALGIYNQVITTLSDFENASYDMRCFLDKDIEGEIEFTYILLEGDWTNKTLPQYFEGLKSIGEKEDGNHKISISSVGKNLCPYNNAEFQAIETRPWIDMLGVEGIYGGSNVANRTRTWFYLSEGKYKLSYKTENCIIQVIDKNENILDLSRNFKGGYVCIRIKSNTTSGTYSIKDLQIELSETQTHYEPYKEDKKEISLNEPLRGVGDTKDTIEKINGEWKIVRRCRGVVLNGTEDWTDGSNGGITDSINKMFALDIRNKIDNKNINIISDKMITYNADYTWKTDIEGMSLNANGTLQIRLNPEKYSNNTNNASFKNWLSQNPLKCIHKLETPIIEDISPITLQCWKNGTISIDEVIPAETTHTVALNKSAQIQKNIEELTVLRNRVKALEEQYDKTALNQAYEVELLRLDMQLDNII